MGRMKDIAIEQMTEEDIIEISVCVNRIKELEYVAQQRLEVICCLRRKLEDIQRILRS